jgi:RNA polymerase sigma factor (sigma-70 family)
MRADQDTVLARRAAAGDGAAFATLYDRHERRAYNLCYRITGSAEDAADATQDTFLKVLERLPSLDDRELNFGSYLLTAARHASYDAIARHKRVTPTGEIPDHVVPPSAAADEPALMAAHQEQIRAANQQLPARQREVLALRELEDLSYDEVADIMGMNRNSVAQLISRARINLRDGLRRTALGSIPPATPDCEFALPLIALAQDDALEDSGDADWLAAHVTGCSTCRLRVAAMEEAGAAYRQWLPLVPALWLRSDVARAAERTAARTRSLPGRRMAALAGVGAALLIGAGLAAADVVHAPGRAPLPASEPVLAAAPTPAPKPHVVHRRRHAKPKPKPKAEPTPRVVTVAAAATPVPTAVPTPPQSPPAAKPKPKPKPKPHEQSTPAGVAEVPADLGTPDPPPDDPVVTDPPPPDDPPDPDPPPPRPWSPNCTVCGIQGPPQVP